MRLDTYDKIPQAMREYLSNYGWHFSKKMVEWAVSMMRDREGNKIKPKDKDALMDVLIANNINASKVLGYDIVYIDAMARADYYGGCIPNDNALVKFLSDYINDKDGYDGMALTRFYADCLATNKPIFWEDLL